MKTKHLYFLGFAALIFILGFFVAPRYTAMSAYEKRVNESKDDFTKGKVADGVAALELALKNLKEARGNLSPETLQQVGQIVVLPAAQYPQQSFHALQFLKDYGIPVSCELRTAVLERHLTAAKDLLQQGEKIPASKVMTLAAGWAQGCTLSAELTGNFNELSREVAAAGGIAPSKAPSAAQPAPAAAATTEVAAIAQATAQTATPSAPATSTANLISEMNSLSPTKYIPNKEKLNSIMQLPGKIWAKIVSMIPFLKKPAPQPAQPTASATPPTTAPAPAATTAAPSAPPAAVAAVPQPQPKPMPAPKPVAAKPAPTPAPAPVIVAPAPSPKPAPAPVAKPANPLAAGLSKLLISKGIRASSVTTDNRDRTIAVTFRSDNVGTPKLVDDLKVLFAAVDDSVTKAAWPASRMKVAVLNSKGSLVTTWWVGMNDYRAYRNNKITGPEFRSRWSELIEK